MQQMMFDKFQFVVDSNKRQTEIYRTLPPGFPTRIYAVDLRIKTALLCGTLNFLFLKQQVIHPAHHISETASLSGSLPLISPSLCCASSISRKRR